MEGADKTINVKVDAEKAIDTLKEEENRHELSHNFRSTQEILNIASYIRNTTNRNKRPSLSNQLKTNMDLNPRISIPKHTDCRIRDIALEQCNNDPSTSEKECCVHLRKELLNGAQKWLKKRKSLSH